MFKKISCFVQVTRYAHNHKIIKISWCQECEYINLIDNVMSVRYVKMYFLFAILPETHIELYLFKESKVFKFNIYV